MEHIVIMKKLQAAVSPAAIVEFGTNFVNVRSMEKTIKSILEVFAKRPAHDPVRMPGGSVVKQRIVGTPALIWHIRHSLPAPYFLAPEKAPKPKVDWKYTFAVGRQA